MDFFRQTINSHLQGNGCRKCADTLIKGGYSEHRFQTDPTLKTEPAVFYILRMKYGDEAWVKIGITKYNAKDRYNRTEYRHLTITVISEQRMTLYEAWKLEQKILQQLSDYQYTPKAMSTGHTECFEDQVIETVVESSQQAITREERNE